ncbi:TonB system transport protein ExbD [Brevundimonas sp. LM2]|uniref:TonB system transport protein ExbD n=1 Tax=Brevundimonas sp. LM2 TaxID=1938605 RepID=UPI000983CC1A|nr:TonB system transport protein ExbD [Brevundimonas sp. LM2]AQR61706.1 TonB system transport protein ExbD [Brevundimonas sp. LM2]
MALRPSSTDDELEVTHEINVTPFIDVMLVLLIIFMIAAPLVTVEVPVDLPISSAEVQPREQEPVYLTLQSDLTVSLNESVLDRATLARDLDALTKGDKGARVFLRADNSVDYGDLMKLMDELRQAGYLKVALVALQDDPASNGPAPIA